MMADSEARAGNRLTRPPRVLKPRLSQNIASLVCGIDSMEVLKQDLAIARAFRPMPEDEMKKLLDRVKDVAGDGRHERFKSTQLFDGPYHRIQHGLTQKEVEGT